MSATSLIARSVRVKLEADVPDFTIQLILSAVCRASEALPSASLMREEKLPTVCESSETAPSALVMRVSKPPTV